MQKNLEEFFKILDGQSEIFIIFLIYLLTYTISMNIDVFNKLTLYMRI